MSPFRNSLVAALIAAFACASEGWANILNVPTAQFPTIQSAIDFSLSGDEIRIGPGSYSEALVVAQKQLRIVSTLGPAVTLISPPPGTGIDIRDVSGTGCTLVGITISGATASGIRISSSTVRIENCTISACRDAVRGGGIFATNASLTIISSKLVQCEVGGGNLVVSGGGLFASNSSVTASDSKFDRCGARNAFPTGSPFYVSGGGVILESCLATLTNCQFLACAANANDTSAACGNYQASSADVALDASGGASASGGGIAITAGSDVLLSGCLFDGAAASARQKAFVKTEFFAKVGMVTSYGGSIAAFQAANLVIQGSEIRGSGTTSDFDGPWSYGGSGRCNGPINYYKNIVAWEALGGSIFADGGALRILNSTIDGGSVGGALRPDFDGLTATPDPNFAGLSGGVVYARNTSSTEVSQSTIRGSTGSQVVLSNAPGAFFSVTASGSGTASRFLTVSGVSPIVNRCALNNYLDECIQSSSGAVPVVSETLMCGNGALGVSGSWIDGGGNLISATCIGADCNHDGVDDAFQIAIGTAADCNKNGIPDSCDVNAGTSSDCDGNDVPDECQYPSAAVTSPSLSPLQSGTLLSHTFPGLNPSGSAVVATFEAQGDLSSTLEFVTVKANGSTLAKLWEVGGQDCVPLKTEVPISAEQFNSLLGSSGVLQFQFVPSAQVTPGQCTVANIKVSLEYQPCVVGDTNGNGQLDACEAGRFDLDQNGMIDMGDVALLMLDFGSCPNCATDFDGNGSIDFGDIALLMLQFGSVS